MDGTLAFGIAWARSRDSQPKRPESKRSPSNERPPGDPPFSGLRGSALVVTNLTKLGGLVLAMSEALIRTELRPGVLAIAAFMMAGAQGLETLLDRVLGR